MGTICFSTTKWVSIDFDFGSTQHAEFVRELEAWIKASHIRFAFKEKHFWVFMPDDAAKVKRWMIAHGATRLTLSTRVCKHCGRPQ